MYQRGDPAASAGRPGFAPASQARCSGPNEPLLASSVIARLNLARIVVCLIAVATAAALLASPESATTIPLGGRSVTLYVSPSGGDRNDCSRARPCASFDAAYRLAPAGAVVEVAGGTYPTQLVNAVAGKSGGANIVFRPATRAKVIINDELDIFASNIEFADMSMQVWYVKPGARNVTLRRLNTGLLFITSATDIRVLGGDVGPWQNTSSQIKACSGCPNAPSGILIDGVTFHDYTRTDAKAHDECLEVFPATGLTLRRNRFRNCAIMDLLISGYAGIQPRDILIENNYFDRPGAQASALSSGFYSVYIDSRAGSSLQNILIRNNSALATMYVATAGVSVNNVSFIANIGPRSPRHCYEGVTFAYNVWDGARCGTTDRLAPPGFVNPATLDLRLLPHAAAINHGDPTSYPRVDIFGTRRPQGGLPDAGAYETR
jgi:hypothetical protein